MMQLGGGAWQGGRCGCVDRREIEWVVRLRDLRCRVSGNGDQLLYIHT